MSSGMLFDERPEPELLAGLNAAQRVAVEHVDGPLLILAGAGSGKTRVITRRIAHLIQVGAARPQEILAITFTNKAAREMRERVATLVPQPGLWISTFHSMCARILRMRIDTLGSFTRDFTIYDTADKTQLVRQILKDLSYDTKRFRPAMVSGWISEWKSTMWAESVDGVSNEEIQGYEDEVFVRTRRRYEEALIANNALDFDDLLIRTLQLFERVPLVRDEFARRFRYVSVDEYQDTNRIQYRLTRHLADYHGNLAVCGDPDQSIYAWRGADIRNILDFEKDWPGARVVKLERNYRSTGHILKAAQAVIKNNAERKEKDLYTEAGDGACLESIQGRDENDEADAIAGVIGDLRREGTAYSEIAILYRVNFMQRALERGLRFAGIPYQVVGGVEFYKRREIRDLVAYLQLIVNPNADVAFTRVANVPARGIGDKSLEKLSAWARDRRVPLTRAAASSEARALIRGRAKNSLAAFAELFVRWEPLASMGASDALERVIEDIEYLAYLDDDDPEAATRLENVDELRAHAEAFDREFPEEKLRGFLQEISLVSEVDGFRTEAGEVALMTLHAAKGLEFDVVFIAGLEEELLPHFNAQGDEGIEEERRLLYVGITRARQRLFLSSAMMRNQFGEYVSRQTSRFMDEIPRDLFGDPVEPSAPAVVLGEYDGTERYDLNVGDRVRHDHFGDGVVEDLVGSGANARTTVFFDRAGRRTLLLAYAKLAVQR
jgi:DNA helicase II / ATP-dependent DNA helicase PcrA